MPLGEEDIEKLFAQREEIDRTLVERHSREMAVMFTDIVGSTQFFEQKGDIAGLQLLRRHNDLLFPVVTAHRGRVIKTIGDAIMAVFDSADDAVRCALGLHRALDSDRVEPRIHIRIGAHFGRAFATGNDVFGDTVNTAARVAHEARGDEILVSQALFEKVADKAGLAAVPRGALPLKGKAEPLPVVAVPWNDRPMPAAPPISAPAEQAPPSPAQELFVLELQVAARGLKVVALDGAEDKGTIKAYAEVPIERTQLDDLARRFGTFMHKGGAESYVERIREQGAQLFSRCLSERARKHLLETSCQALRLQLDDELVHVPWELMYDGNEFLALRFAIGRVVSARSDTSPALRLPGSNPGPAVVISNAAGDLPAADHEGEAVSGLLQDGFSGSVRHLKGPVRRAEFLAALPGCSLLHVAGHADQPTAKDPGGFVVADGRVTPEELAVAVGRSAPPVVFANSCHASTGLGFTDMARGTSDLASALLLRGTQHYIGPMWEIGDDDALAFALRFYEGALTGVPLGEAARLARMQLSKTSRHPLSFAGYVLYGEPRTAMRRGMRAPAAVRSRSKEQIVAATVTPPLSSPGSGVYGGGRSMLPLAVGGGLAAAVVAGAAVIFFTAHPPRPVEPALPPRPTVAIPPTPPTVPAVVPTPRAPHTGPVRLCVFPFKNLGDDELKLGAALQENLYTEFAGDSSITLTERGHIELDVGEMDFEAKYADPATRAALGRLTGSEVAMVGGYQHLGTSLRVFARFIDVESGEVLSAFKLDAPVAKALDLEEQVAVRAREALAPLKKKLRP